MRLATALTLALLLAGCQLTTAPPGTALALAQAIPPDYKEQIRQEMKKQLRDPFSVKEPEITAPGAIFTGLADGGHAPGVCVRFFAKNAYGAYAGQATYAVSFRNGKLYTVTEAMYNCEDGKVTWQPFPELIRT